MCLQQFTTSPSILLSYQYCMLCLHVDLIVSRADAQCLCGQFNKLTDINPLKLEIVA